MSRRRKGRDVNGILVIDKPMDITSNGILQQVKRLFGAAKAGHTGALDPLATGILPIALGYHIAHFLTNFLVDGQFVIKAARAALGLEDIRVTAGFLSTPGTVKVIWLTQAGAVVTGHVIAILVAHALALRLFGGTRRAVLSQAPLAIFMIAYTFFGLWLLASPRGM